MSPKAPLRLPSRIRKPAYASRLLFGLFLLLSISALIRTSAHADLPGRYKIHTWQVQHGLPHNNVLSILQTPDGFLWFATPTALARFDGHQFWTLDSSRIPELGGSKIREIHTNPSGVIWIATEDGGLVQFEHGSFKALHAPVLEEAKSRISGIATDDANRLWVLLENGALFQIEASAPKQLAPPSPDLYPHRLFRTPKAEVWSASRRSLQSRSPEMQAPLLDGNFGQYQFLAPAREGGWWIAMGGKVRLWQQDRWTAELGSPEWERHTVTAAMEDSHGRLWVGTQNQGLLRYDRDGSVESFSTANGLASDQIQALCEDHEGNIWVGTRGGGVNRLHRGLFQPYTTAQGLPSNSLTCLINGSQGDVWIGTDAHGLARWKDGIFNTFEDSTKPPPRDIRSLAIDSKGSIWIGTESGKLFKKFADRFNPSSLAQNSGNQIRAILADESGRILLGSDDATALLVISGSQTSSIPLPDLPSPADVTCILEHPKGTLWVGTRQHGLLQISEASKRRFLPKKEIPGEAVTCLAGQPDGSLWIGTAGGGLLRIKDGRISLCGKKEGLFDLNIHHIADDGLGFFWMSSNQGIFRISQNALGELADKKRTSIDCHPFGTSDGLPSPRCVGGRQPSGCRSSDGQLWFLTARGAVSVDPRLPENTRAPVAVRILELKVDGEPHLSASKSGEPSGNAAAVLRIAPGKHHLEFQYSGIHFSAPETVRFRYRLEGVDRQWVEVGAERVARYSDIPAGTRRFEVMAATPLTGWPEKGASIVIEVEPQLWERPWFPAVASLGSAGVLALIVRALTRRRWRARLREVELQQKVESERNRIAQDIHDDLGAGLTQISWLGEMSRRMADNPDQVRSQSDKIMATAHEMVASLDEIVWAVRPQNDSLPSLLEYLGRRVDEMFEKSPIRLRYLAPKTLPDIGVSSEFRHHFFLICKEILHNALKHSKATEVSVETAFFPPSTLQIQITDNGVGFDGNTLDPDGNGLGNIQSRTERIRGNLHRQTSPGAGCRYTLTVPLS